MKVRLDRPSFGLRLTIRKLTNSCGHRSELGAKKDSGCPLSAQLEFARLYPHRRKPKHAGTSMIETSDLPNTANFKFRDIITRLAVLYRQGLLVPFIGSGMSAPSCATWQPFIENLAGSLGIQLPARPGRSKLVEEFLERARAASISIPKEIDNASGTIEATTLYRLADKVIAVMRSMTTEERGSHLRAALNKGSNEGEIEIPTQPKSLASIAWPLAITTNYDDLYFAAADGPIKALGLLNLQIAGRGIEDCHNVLTSLDQFAPPLVWAIQGFLGGQARPAEETIPDHKRRLQLADQVVLGHQQYQTAINGAPHFRRAFAEVFRRRSLLFMGSGILEDYLVNLFGEIIHHHGPGPLPHFAFLPEDQRHRFDPTFLQTRLGIVPVFYDNHARIPEYIDTLATAIKTRAGAPAEFIQDEVAFRLTYPNKAPESTLSVRIINRPLPLPTAIDRKECSLVSVGRKNGVPLLGQMASSHLKAAVAKSLLTDAASGSCSLVSGRLPYTFRFGKSPIYAVAARRATEEDDLDQRDLAIIPEAVKVSLQCIEADGHEVVLMGAVASGPDKPWHQIHPFAQILRGIQQFIKDNKAHKISNIDIHLVGWQVWNAVVAGKIPIAQLLSSDLACHHVQLVDRNGHTESVLLTLPHTPSLRELLLACEIDSSNWDVAILPSPDVPTQSGEISLDTPIAPTMVVMCTARH